MEKLEKNNVNLISPLIWAYVGDSVYDLYIRTHLVKTTNLKPDKLHKEAIKYVSAKAQSLTLGKLQGILTEEEKDIVRRGRNTTNHHIPRNTDVKDYSYSTAFEGLIGYLYLSDNKQRLDEILKKCIEA